MDYPAEIEGARLEIAATREQIKRRRAKLRTLEIDIAVEATTAKDPETGKLLLSNDTMRKAAIEKMVAESEEFSELATELGNLEQDETRLQTRLDRYLMEWKLYLLDREQQVYQSAIDAADALFEARRDNHIPIPRQVEAEIDFGF